MKVKQIEQRLQDHNQAQQPGQAKIYSSIKGFLQSAKDKAATVKVPEDVSGKLSSVKSTVSTGASSLSSSIASIQNTEGGLMTKVNLAAN